MSKATDGHDLTRVGPGTIMGEMMRQYWIPAALSSELKADGDPMRLMLLGEPLIAFRDSSGRVGVLDHQCPHRCASLFLGRNEENGIRCVYHGWKFDVEGRCLEMPNVPPPQDFKEKVRAKSYKVQERAGLIWVYMGARAEAPPMPMLEALFVPEQDLSVSMLQRQSNWLQGLEGDIDTSHFGFLHAGHVKAEDFEEGHPARHTVANRAPEYKVADTEWGTMYGAYRPDTNNRMHWRMAHFCLPFWTQTPNADFADHVVAKAWVPMDDTHTMLISIFGGRARGATYSSMKLKKSGTAIPGAEPLDYLPNSTDWFGRWRAVQNLANDWQIDREAQHANRIYSGIRNIVMQDQAVTESMGLIVDHTKEHLAPSDIMIARTRRRLLTVARDLAEDGTVPPGVDDAGIFWKARAGSFYADDKIDWQDAYQEQLKSAVRWPAPDRQAAE
ncbi:MAG TPA: Rieske 2Fe-2S domain-containing protein [Bradyrhizobium sp.]|uniref:Rieske 2Fe-2S domain-containing protein n=1 Tax=Bradyrhizobium sp. TaxID=376 RepID=UPI002BCD36DD|nr:Rieske 2Fe-2S domain-containing protein [Bradyrhizobium sp.]HTA99775.1 Rieske 2Fe-2S domain-containing protein [Bradyrhizobium sp.]